MVAGEAKRRLPVLEDEIHTGAKLNALSIGHREQAVLVQNAVECFKPIRDQCHYRKCSIVRVGRLLDHVAGAGGQHTIEPLLGVVVHVPQKTDPGHGFGVHDVHDVLLVLPLIGIFEHFPDCGLPATRGPQRHQRPFADYKLWNCNMLAICVSMSLSFISSIASRMWISSSAYSMSFTVTLGKNRRTDLGNARRRRNVSFDLRVNSHCLFQQDRLFHIVGRFIVIALVVLQQPTCERQDGFQQTESPLVVLLHRKQLPRQQEHRHNALSHDLRTLQTLGKHHHFRDQLVVGYAPSPQV